MTGLKIVERIVPQYIDYKLYPEKKPIGFYCEFFKSLDEDYLETKKVDLDDKSYPFVFNRPFYVVPEKNLKEIILPKRGTLFVVPEEPVYCLLISNRSIQIAEMVLLLRSYNIRVDYLAMGRKKYDPKAQVLVSQVKSSGAGFSDSKFSTNYYISDITKIEQPFGRIRIDGGIHFDIVDDNSTIKNHYRARKRYYASIDAEIHE